MTHVNGVPTEAQVNVVYQRVLDACEVEAKVELYRCAMLYVYRRIRAARKSSQSINVEVMLTDLLGHRRTVIDQQWRAIDRVLVLLLRRMWPMIPRERRQNFIREACRRVPKESFLHDQIIRLAWTH